MGEKPKRVQIPGRFLRNLEQLGILACLSSELYIDGEVYEGGEYEHEEVEEVTQSSQEQSTFFAQPTAFICVVEHQGLRKTRV